MKKGLVVVSILVILILTIVGWLKYRQWKSYQKAIPADTELLVNVKADRLIWKGIQYIISHPSEWSGPDKKTNTKSPGVKRGIEIPSNIFIYTREGYPEILNVSLPVSNKEQVQEFLRVKVGVAKFQERDGTLIGKAENETLIFTLDEGRLLVSYHVKKKKIDTAEFIQFDELLSPTEVFPNFGSTDHGDINMTYGDINLNLTTEGKLMRLEAGLSDNSIDPTELPFVGDFLSSTWNDEIRALLDDSEELYIELDGTVDVSDTIITYEFNDDFEKVEKKSVREYDAPAALIKIKLVDSDAEKISERLPSISSLMGKNGLRLIKSEEGILSYSNSPEYQNFSILPKGNIWVKLNLNTFLEATDLPFESELLNKVESVVISMTESEKGKIIECEITMLEHVIPLLKDRF